MGAAVAAFAAALPAAAIGLAACPAGTADAGAARARHGMAAEAGAPVGRKVGRSAAVVRPALGVAAVAAGGLRGGMRRAAGDRLSVAVFGPPLKAEGHDGIRMRSPGLPEDTRATVGVMVR